MIKRGDKVKILNSRKENCFEFSVDAHIGKTLIVTSIRDETSIYAETEDGIEFFYLDEIEKVGD